MKGALFMKALPQKNGVSQMGGRICRTVMPQLAVGRLQRWRSAEPSFMVAACLALDGSAADSG